VGVIIPQPSTGARYPSTKVTIALVIINALLYVATSLEKGLLSISNRWLQLGAYIPALCIEPSQWYRLFSSMFLHANLFHIFFNMLYLYTFGRAVESALGGKRYLALYFLSGLLAELFHTAFIPIEGPISAVVPAIGASGAISGVLGAYLLLFPNSRISICFFYFFFPICFAWRAAAYLIFWFLTQIVEGYLGNALGVAVFAHVGGFIGGLALLPLMADRERLRLLRMLTTGRGYLYHVYAGGGGLGYLSKLILMVAILSIMVGGAYSAFSTKGMMSSLRVLDFKVNYEMYCGAALPCKGFEEEPVVIKAYGPSPSLLSPISSDSVRVVFNRLNALGFLYGKGRAGESLFVDKSFTANVLGFDLKVVLKMQATYDADGFLSRAKGNMKTDVLTCLGYRCFVSGMGVYNFEIDAIYGGKGGGTLEGVVTALALASLCVSLMALDSLIRRAEELAIVT